VVLAAGEGQELREVRREELQQEEEEEDVETVERRSRKPEIPPPLTQPPPVVYTHTHTHTPYIISHRRWRRQAIFDTEVPLAGITVDKNHATGWYYVREIEPNSPAERCGLIQLMV